MNKQREEAASPTSYASVGSDNWPGQVVALQERIQELQQQLDAAKESVPGLGATGVYTSADVDLIEAFRKKPYARLRQTVNAYEEAQRLLAHTFTTFIDGERCWCHPASQPTSDTHSAFCLDARAHTRDLLPPKKT